MQLITLPELSLHMESRIRASVLGRTPQQVLADLRVPPDFSCGGVPAAPFRYTHRRLDDGTEIYFVANKRDTAQEGPALFASTTGGLNFGDWRRDE